MLKTWLIPQVRGTKLWAMAWYLCPAEMTHYLNIIKHPLQLEVIMLCEIRWTQKTDTTCYALFVGAKTSEREKEGKW